MRLGVALLNLGGPSRLSEVKPFLINLFSDPDIIPIPLSRWFQKPLALLIATLRESLSCGYYRAIGGGSPLQRITREQANALERRLKKHVDDVTVYIAMRYWHPSTESMWNDIMKDQITDLVVLPLYPQYSIATTGSSYKVLKQVMKKNPAFVQRVAWIDQWYDAPLYVDAFVENIESAIKTLPPSFKNDFDLIFSAHSLPLKFIKDGDPYEEQIHETMHLILKRLGAVLGSVTLGSVTPAWHLSYQSKTGPIRWLEPSTSNLLKQLSRQRKRALVMVPISFVSDHVETLYEIDILYRSEALGLQFPYFCRVSSLNLSEKFIGALEALVLKEVDVLRLRS